MPKGSELSPEEKYILLRDISLKIKDTLDLNNILNLLLEQIKTVLDYDAAGIFVLSETIENLDLHKTGQKIAGIAKFGFEERPVQSDKMLWEGKGIVGYAISSKESIIIDDVRNDDRYIVGRKETLSEIAVPIIKDGKAIGALNIESDKPSSFNNHHVEILQFFADASAISIEKAILHQKILENRKLEEQMKIAKDVQSSLLPDYPPKVEGYDLAGVCMPTYEIGGNYYDYIMLDENNLAIVIADISGDGVPAALIMAAFRSMLRYQIKSTKEPSVLMHWLNQQIPEFSRKRDFITIVYGQLNIKEHKFTYTNSGHNPPIIVRANGDLDLLKQNGPAINILKNAEYNTPSVHLAPGDQIIFYTDGIIETFTNDLIEFGFERLKQIIKNYRNENPGNMISHIIDSTKSFTKVTFFRDDITLVILKRKEL